MRATSCCLAFFFLCITFSSGFIFRVSAAAAALALASTGLPLPLVGKSRICPTLDLTTNSAPKYLLIVLAFAGDSTMTNDFDISVLTYT